MSDHNSINSSCNVKIPWPGQSDKTMSCLSLASACMCSSGEGEESQIMLYVQRLRRGIINHVVCAAVEWRNYKLCCMCSGGGEE